MSTAKFKVNPNRKLYIQRRRRRRRQRDPGKNANQHGTSGPYTKFQPNLPQNMPTLKYRVQSIQTNDRRCPRRNSQEEEEEEEKEEICPPWSRPPNQTPKKPHEKERPSPPLPTRSTNQPTMARTMATPTPHCPKFPQKGHISKRNSPTGPHSAKNTKPNPEHPDKWQTLPQKALETIKISKIQKPKNRSILGMEGRGGRKIRGRLFLMEQDEAGRNSST